MNSFREQCIELRKQDKSIIDIMKITGRAKSSIHTHIKDIPLSEERIQQYKAAAGDRIKKFALERKGKSQRPFKSFERWSRETVSLVAHLLFDGGVYPSNGCAYSNRSTALREKVEEYMKLIYEFEPIHYKDPVTEVRRISYYNVALAIYMEKKVRDLLQKVRYLSPDLKKEFIQAFFDDEGCVDYRPEEKRRSIRGYQKDTKILKLVRGLLADMDISARVIKPNEVVIVGKENLIRFEREINFSPGVYINGNRSNSRWKKHVEKRELLRRAIESFKS